MIVVDASALVALVMQGDVHHADAKKGLAAGPFYVAPGSLVEAAQAIRRLLRLAGEDPATGARKAIRAIVGQSGFRDAPPVAAETAVRLFERYPGLSLDDAWPCAVALELDMPLLTFDKAQAAAFKRERRGR